MGNRWVFPGVIGDAVPIEIGQRKKSEDDRQYEGDGTVCAREVT